MSVVGVASTSSTKPSCEAEASSKRAANAKKNRIESELKVEEDQGGGDTERKMGAPQARDVTIVANSFFNEFVDCMQNLPNRLQVLFTELSTIDAVVKRRHRTLQCIKLELTKRTNSDHQHADDEPADEEYRSYPLDQLLAKLHQTLLECQHLGDQKVRITSQIIETICNKTRQLGLDCKSNEERKFNFDLNEDRIVAEFKQAVRKTRPLTGNNCYYNGSVNNISSRTSTRNSTNNLINSGGKHKNLIEMSKYSTKSSPIHNMDAYSFDNDHSSTLNSFISGMNSNSPRANGLILSNSNKSLKNINNIFMNNGSKKNFRINNKSESPGVNGKRSVKKFKGDFDNDYSINTTDSYKLKMDQNNPSGRPKRQLNYNPSPVKQSIVNNFSSSSSSSSMHHHLNAKKRRLSHHLKSSSNNHQCRSPSSLSTTSTCSSNQIGQTKSSNYMLLSRAGKLQQMKKQQQTGVNLENKKPTKRLKTNSKQGKKFIKSKKLNGMNHKSTGEEDENERDDDDDDEDEEDDDDDDVSLSNDEIEFDGMDELDNEEDENGRKNRFDRVTTTRDTRLSDDSDSSLGAVDKMESDIDLADLKPPNSSSNETESIKQLDDDENEFASKTGDKSTGRPNDQVKPPKSEYVETVETSINNSENHQTESSVKKKSARNSGTSASNNHLKSNNSNSDLSTAPSTSNHRQMNEDEPLYCLCREISYGQMILCDNDACKIEWFHFQCVKLTSKPKGKWYCPHCRGETHRVMKKSHNHMTSSSSSMASPSYYSNFSYSTRNK